MSSLDDATIKTPEDLRRAIQLNLQHGAVFPIEDAQKLLEASEEDAGEIYKIVSEELSCPICLETVMEARLTSCKHLLCRTCLRDLCLDKEAFCNQCGTKKECARCPICGATIEDLEAASTLVVVDRLITLVRDKFEPDYKDFCSERQKQQRPLDKSMKLRNYTLKKLQIQKTRRKDEWGEVDSQCCLNMY